MIFLIDPNKDKYGHNLIYKKTLNEISDTSILSLDLKLKPNDTNLFALILNRYFSFRKQLRSGENYSLMHFLHADLYYAFPFLFKFYNLKRNVILTMHYFPSGFFRRKLVVNFCNKANGIIVHSQYLKNKYEREGVKNVHLIDYPSFYDYSKFKKSEVRKKFSLSENLIVLSALGGTRYEKGLDILINSFQYLSQDTKNRIILNIAGQEEAIKEDYIREKVDKLSINCRINLRNLEDEEFMENVIVSDFIVIPYRQNFNGNSGPMTEAIVNEIPCIVSNHGNLGDITLTNGIGVVFETENPISLAEVIERAIKISGSFNFNYKEKLNVKNFINEHRILYEQYSKIFHTVSS